jgi:hypothetical protein
MADAAPPSRGLARGPAVIILGLLMLAVLAGVLWASGMVHRPGHPAIGQPAYQLPDHSTSDTAPR